MLSMIEQEKKLIFLSHYFLCVVYHGKRQKIHSVITLFSASCVWWSKRKNSLCYNHIFWIFSMMEEKKKLVLLSHYFFYVVRDERREKTNSVLTLFFLCCLWRRKTKKSFCYHIIFLCFLWCRRGKNWFFYNIIFCMFSMMEQEKKLILWPYYFLYVVYDEGREKTHFVITLFFVSCLWWSKKKNWFC